MAPRLDNCVYMLNVISVVNAGGLLLLYRPKDVSTECATSRQLRYDLTFGMGMSDTITLVFRALAQLDYECSVDIAANHKETPLIAVVRYPNGFRENCEFNRDAFTVIRKRMCINLCDQPWDVKGNYLVMPMKGRMRFRFVSNSSINNDMRVNMYQVTVTASRQEPPKGCVNWNESLCVVDGKGYCYTTGVVCDGIKNCGVSDWFDERKSSCILTESTLGITPVIAVIAAVLCCLLAASHVLMKCLPPLAHSFFIFNANEDNRLCIDSVYKNTGTITTIPIQDEVESTSPTSSDSDSEDPSLSFDFGNTARYRDTENIEPSPITRLERESDSSRKNTITNLTRRFQEKMRSFTRPNKKTDTKREGETKPSTFDV